MIAEKKIIINYILKQVKVVENNGNTCILEDLVWNWPKFKLTRFKKRYENKNSSYNT